MCEDYRLTRYCDDYHDINERKQKLEALIKRECPHTRIIIIRLEIVDCTIFVSLCKSIIFGVLIVVFLIVC